MTTDYWTVFAAVVLPYVPYLLVGFEKWRRGIYDPNNPRDSNSLLEGWALRAKGAELNSWEALTAYATVTGVAHAVGADPEVLARLGIAWVVARVLYVGAYVAGIGWARMAFWFTSVGLILARMWVAASV